MSCVRDKDNRDSRVFTTHFDELELSERARRMVASKKSVQAKAVLERLGLLPEEKDSAIETNMDAE